MDLVGRLYAQELPKYIPGSPSIVVENIDGGGGAVGMLEVAERSEADGLSIVVASTGILLRWLLEEEGHTYNLDRMPILGALPSNRVVAARADAAGTIQDAVDAEEPLPFGATTTSSGMGLFGALSSSLLGMNVDMIYGFDGEADGVLAFERGELALFSPNDSIYLTQFVDMDAIPLYQSGVQTEEGNFERSELTPDIPTFEEVYQEMMGEDPAGEEWDALTAVIAAEAGHTSVFVHEDTPEGQVEVLQSAFRDMIEDSDWPAATESAVGEAMAGIGPERARSVVDDLAGLSDEARALLQSVAEGNG